MAMTQILRLKPAFTDQQAEALAGLFDDALASKVDLEALRIATKSDLDRLQLELKGEIDKLRLEVERDLKGVEARLVAWLFGQGLAVIGILFALLRFVDK